MTESVKQQARIGIIGAMQIETEGLLAEMTDKKTHTVSGVTYTEGMLCGKQVVVATSGVGKVFAAVCAEAMILRFGVSALLNTGVAGGLLRARWCSYRAGDARGLLSGINVIKLETDRALLKPLCEATAALGYNAVVGTVATGDLFVTKESTKERLAAEFDAVACEMEGGAIGHVAYINSIPFVVLRTISDGGDGMEYAEFAPLAAKTSTAITKTFLELLP